MRYGRINNTNISFFINHTQKYSSGCKDFVERGAGMVFCDYCYSFINDVAPKSGDFVERGLRTAGQRGAGETS